MVQTIYNLFSCSPQRWDILLSHVGSSLHGLSCTRWTNRVASVRPFAAHLPGIQKALEDLLFLNLTRKTTIEVNGTIKYVTSFTCIVVSALWLKVLVPIDQRNQVIQAREATVDVEVSNLRSLSEELKELRSQWPMILSESKLVANSLTFWLNFRKIARAGEMSKKVEMKLMKSKAEERGHSSVMYFIQLLIR